MPRSGVVYTIVVENDEKQITDFVSFYNLPSQILKQEGHTHTRMNVAYLYYYHNSEFNSLTELMKYTLYFAKELADEKFDVFNCLQIMDNHLFLNELKFGVGDGVLNYYMYNYVLAEGGVPPNKLGTVLV
jgi:glycylpeptide N-tetradecanoyltransferase